jgi:hypothetical protein
MTNSWKEDWHWFALLSITVLVNIPMLSPTLLFSNDTLHALIFFHFTYANLFLHNEIPNWIPYLAYGSTFDFYLFNTIQPTDYVVMAFGWLCGIRDSLLLYKISLILTQGILILGLYLLSRKLFTSLYYFSPHTPCAEHRTRSVRATMPAVWMVCLGGLLTTNWMFCSPWSLTSYYMVPLVLWFVLRFLESKNPAHLWMAGLVEGLSLLGTIPYIAPIHLLIVVSFLVPILCREPGLFRTFVSWRNFVHPLFFVFCGYYLLLGTWINGLDLAWLAPGRDPETGNVPLDMFLGKDKQYHRQALGLLLRLLVRGDLYYGDSIPYIGLLPLAALVYALLRRRDTLFLSVAVVALVLFWFSLGGWFTELCYYGFPMMKKYRFVSAVWMFLRIFLLLLGGFGFEQILRDLRCLPAPSPLVFSMRERRVVFLVLACTAVDLLFHGSVEFYTATDFVFQGERWPELFAQQSASLDLRQSATLEFQSRFHPLWQELIMARRRNDVEKQKELLAAMQRLQPENQILLAIRYSIYAATLGFLWLLLTLRRRRVLIESTNWIRWVGPMLFAVYLADVGFFYSQVEKQAPFMPPETPIGNALTVTETNYRPRRHEESSLPADAMEVLQVIKSPRGGSPGQNKYGSFYVLMQCDLAVQDWRLDTMMPVIKKMIETRKIDSERNDLFQTLRRDAALRRSLGDGLDKARMVRDRDVLFAENEKEAIARFRSLPDPDMKIIVLGKPSTPRGDEPTHAILRAGTLGLLAAQFGEGPWLAASTIVAAEPSLPDVKVTHFSANRIVVKIPAGASGWLFYADAYDPGWKAIVDGENAEVHQADMGFKAVHLPSGAREVTFYFDRGWRDLHGLVFIIASALLAFAVTGLLLAAPWVLAISRDLPNKLADAARSPAATESHWQILQIWSAVAWLAALAAALFMFPDFVCLSLIIVFLAGTTVVIVSRVRGRHD